MYPSSNNLGNTTTTSFSFTTNNPFPPDNNNNSTTIFDHSTSPNFSSFHPIHSPYSFYEEDLQLHFQEFFLHQQQQQQQQETTVMTSMEKHTDEDGPVNIIEGPGLVLCNNSTTSTSNKQIPRKRTSKKDRHSKINTKHGPRDRRMRLSLDVAQKFFGLQDMLGFDKASKTVHWLLTKSKTAIKHLTNNSSRSGGGNNNNNLGSNTASVSSTSNNSECEVLSGIINDDSSLSLPREVTTTEKVKPREKRVATTKASRGSRAFNPLAKETREKARARARERTMEKRIRLGNGNNYNNNQAIKKMTCIEGMDQSLNRHLRSWSPFEASGGGESSTPLHVLNNIHPSFLQTDYQEAAFQRQHKQGSVNDHSNLFNAPVTWSASPSSSYHQNAAIYHENQFTEFQSFVNPWDHQAYNN